MTRFFLGLTIFVLGATALAQSKDGTRVGRASDSNVKSEVKLPSAPTAAGDRRKAKMDAPKKFLDPMAEMNIPPQGPLGIGSLLFRNHDGEG
jgi:hypothetical protein